MKNKTDKIGWSGVLLLGQHKTVSKITQIRDNMYRVSQYNIYYIAIQH